MNTALCLSLEIFLSLSLFFKKFIYSFSLSVLGLRCCSGFSLVAGGGGCSWAAMLGLLIAVASLVALAVGHGLQGVWVVLCDPPGSRA